MTGNAVHAYMLSCQWKVGVVVIKYIGRIARWVACEAGRAFVNITIYAVVLVVSFRVGMTGHAGEFRIV